MGRLAGGRAAAVEAEVGEGGIPRGRELGQERDEEAEGDEQRRESASQHREGELAVDVASPTVGRGVVIVVIVRRDRGMFGGVGGVVGVHQRAATQGGEAGDEQPGTDPMHGRNYAARQMQVNCILGL